MFLWPRGGPTVNMAVTCWQLPFSLLLLLFPRQNIFSDYCMGREQGLRFGCGFREFIWGVIVGGLREFYLGVIKGFRESIWGVISGVQGVYLGG